MNAVTFIRDCRERRQREPDETPVAPPPNRDRTRIAALERQVRVLRLCVVAAVLVAVADGLHRWFPTSVAATPTSTGAVSPMAFRDANGNLRAAFGMFAGVPVVELYDEAGTARLSMGLKFDGTPFLELAGEDGGSRASIVTGQDGSGALQLRDSSGDVRARFGG